jgi:hypothetical protein
MGMRSRTFGSILLAAAVTTTMFATGCTVHARYYDPYHRDYHPASGEVVYYGQWEHDTHREHRDLRKRSKEERKEYWEWRHSHDH